MYDVMEVGKFKQCFKVFFLEKQFQFVWYVGMFLFGVKMQIFFVKDFVFFRDFCFYFIFFNYFYKNERLVDFINLDIFIFVCVEFEDYFCWCVNYFEDVVCYQNEVVLVVFVQEDGFVKIFEVILCNIKIGVISIYCICNVFVVVGGQVFFFDIFFVYYLCVIYLFQYV